MLRHARKFVAAVGLAVGLGAAAPSSAVPIELALVLDASGSISGANWSLQVNGYANALGAVIPGHFGQVAISVIEFATTANVVRGMTTINNAADLAALQAFFVALAQTGGNTCISCAIFSANGTLTGTAGRSIIDVSTDGGWNVGVDPAGPAGTVGTAAWAVVNGNADVVNALGIGVVPNFAFGTGSFNMSAPNFAAFEASLIAKLGRELPEPGPLALVAIGLLALVLVRRRAG